MTTQIAAVERRAVMDEQGVGGFPGNFQFVVEVGTMRLVVVSSEIDTVVETDNVLGVVEVARVGVHEQRCFACQTAQSTIEALWLVETTEFVLYQISKDRAGNVVTEKKDSIESLSESTDLHHHRQVFAMIGAKKKKKKTGFVEMTLEVEAARVKPGDCWICSIVKIECAMNPSYLFHGSMEVEALL
jgi:hypothetical protein